jgi:hypothetical protein
MSAGFVWLLQNITILITRKTNMKKSILSMPAHYLTGTLGG